MKNKILVTYASRTGTTANIAESIGQTLVAAGFDVDILPMQSVKDLVPYQAVVAGSAIRGSKWLPEAAAFVQANQNELNHKPFAMFTVCITLAMRNGEKYRDGVASWVAPVRALVNPISAGYFPGKLDFNKLTFGWDALMLRLAVFLGIFPKENRIDMQAVHTWEEKLPPLLLK